MVALGGDDPLSSWNEVRGELDGVGGEWLPAVVRGRLREERPLVMLTPVPAGDPVTVQLLHGASGLPARWPRLDQLEGASYTRVLVPAEAQQGRLVIANLLEPSGRNRWQPLANGKKAPSSRALGRYRRTRRGAASRGGCPSTATRGKGGYPLLSIFILSRTGGLAASPGSCRIIAGRGQNLRKWEERNACVVVASGSRGDAEPMVGLAVQSRALGAAAKGCDALVATGVMPAGAWR